MTLLGPAAPRPRIGPAALWTRLAALALVVLLALASLPALGARFGPAITVIYPDPRPPQRIIPITLEGARYVSTNDLARVFGATKYWRPEIQKLTLRIGEHTVRLTVGAPLVLVDEVGWNLVTPPRLNQGIVYAPESILETLFEAGLVAEATYDESARTIRFRSPVHTIRQAQLFPRGRVTEISATLLRGVPPRILYATPSEIRVFFEGGTLDTSRAFYGGAVIGGWIREVPGAVDLRLRLADNVKGYAVSVGSGRLKLSMTDDQALVDAGLFTPLEPIPIGDRNRGVRTIVIDPGHGGSDQGASLPGGLAEKDAALNMARALRSALGQRLGARVILTRDGDADVSAARRAEIANESGADLFISIHLDSYGAIRGGGFRVITLSPLGGGPEGQREAPTEEVDGVPLRLWYAAQSPSAGSSMALAQAVGDSLAHAFPRTPVVIGSGRMRVLEPVGCPALLLESAPASRAGPEAMSRGYTIYDYTRTVAGAIAQVVRTSSG